MITFTRAVRPLPATWQVTSDYREVEKFLTHTKYLIHKARLHYENIL